MVLDAARGLAALVVSDGQTMDVRFMVCGATRCTCVLWNPLFGIVAFLSWLTYDSSALLWNFSSFVDIDGNGEV